MTNSHSSLWGGRFGSSPSQLMQEFNESFSLDKRLWREDIQGSIAHVTMLGEEGILSEKESQSLQEELQKLYEAIENDPSLLSGDYEDIHTFVESKMTEKLGDTGKKMHTARSRNDQVATDMKLYVKRTLKELKREVDAMIDAFQAKGEKTDALIPAYTHLQRAQIVTFKHLLDAYQQMFKRDIQKIDDALTLLDESPLGAGALAGSTYPINRQRTAELLGFDRVQTNFIDSVSNRDFILDALQVFANLMVHMSRFAEDFIIYSSQEFNFVESSDSYATGSSMMPQKKNPDALELIRGKAGKVIGLMTSMYTIMKGLPLTYNKDMQEDKAIYFEAFDTTLACVKILTGFIEEVLVNEDRLNETIHEGYLNATELADYLVKAGLPFRQAHTLVGEIVRFALERDQQIHDLDLEDLQSFSPLIQEDVYEALNPKTILHQGIKKDML